MTTKKQLPPAPAAKRPTRTRAHQADALDRLLAQAVDRAEDRVVKNWLGKLLERGERSGSDLGLPE
jgi:hypothetical protein